MAVLVAVLLALGLLGGLPIQAEAQAQSSVAPSAVVPLRIRVPLFGRFMTFAAAQVGSGPRVTSNNHIGMVSFLSGQAVTAGSYQIGRDADATNQMHFNVPTGAGFEFSINDVAQAQINNSGQVLVLDGTAALPSVAFADEPTTGFYQADPSEIDITIGGARRFIVTGTRFINLSDTGTIEFGGGMDTSLGREAAATLQLGVDVAGVTNQMLKGPDRITSDGVGGNVTIAGGRNRGASAGGSIIFQTSPAAGAGVTGTLADRMTIDEDGNVDINAARLTAGSQTPASNGQIQTAVLKVTIPYTDTAFQAAAVTADVTIATLPAKTFVTHVMTDLTTTFACTAVCTTATLSATTGKTAGGNEYLLSFDADAAAAQFGDASAELGASLAPATVQTLIGDLASWSATTNVTMRLTSGTGNIGTGAATNLSQGSVTFYITTTKYP